MKIFQLLKSLLLFLLLASFARVEAQGTYDFGFKREFDIKVYDEQSNQLKDPWVGGFNSVHFSAIDLNMDGIKDLVVFDLLRDRLMTFINGGTANEVDYTYAPEYEKYFPKINGWIRLVDYDGDGLEDIFTFGFAGIKVYKNTSAPGSSAPSFTLYSQNLHSDQGGFFPGNIQATEVDYPAFADIDGDGDIDILVFGSLGSTIELHENLSMDSTGTNDTIWLKLTHRCWGWFAEDDENNMLILDIQNDPNVAKFCKYGIGKAPGSEKKNPKHVGSTILVIDLNNDGLPDLIMGDTDYSTIIAAYNGGTIDSAHIVKSEYKFPQADTPVYLNSLVSVNFLDLDNDGVKDLAMGAFCPGYNYPKNDNYDNAWFYKNVGTNDEPDFKLQTKNFLIDNMINVGSNSHPVLVDYDNDGLLDLVIGNYGYIDSSFLDPWITLHTFHRASLTLYKNTGTAQEPEFTLVTDDFADVSSLNIVGAYPTFGDINGDGKPDMIIGDTTGKLHYFENVAPLGQPMQLVHVSSNYMNIDVGQFATPQLFDLDKDGLLDLIIGYKNKIWWDSLSWEWKTSLSYYRNTGTATSPQFTLITDSLGGVNANDNFFHYTDGFTAPHFYRDSTGTTYLFLGSGVGYVFFYKNIDGNLGGIFEKDSTMNITTDYDKHYSVQYFKNEDGNVVPITATLKSAVAVADLDGDGYPEMILGSWSGGLQYYKGVKPPGVGLEKTTALFDGNLTMYPNPAHGLVNFVITKGDRSMNVITRVYSMTGQLMLEQANPGDDMFRIDISSLPVGIYTVQVVVSSSFSGTTGVFNKKLVVKQ